MIWQRPKVGKLSEKKKLFESVDLNSQLGLFFIDLHKSIVLALSVLLIQGNEHFVVFKQQDPFTEVTSLWLVSLSHTLGSEDEHSVFFVRPFVWLVSMSCSMLCDCVFDVEFLDEYAFDICSAVLSDDDRKCVQFDDKHP